MSVTPGLSEQLCVEAAVKCSCFDCFFSFPTRWFDLCRQERLMNEYRNQLKPNEKNISGFFFLILIG